jgi:RNA polymerase sigma factor (sigma-70 family)
MVVPEHPSGDLSEGTRLPRPGGDAARTDQHLLAEYKATRCANAFKAIVGRHSLMVFRTSLRVTKHVPDAEDVTQGVFLLLAQSPQQVKHNLAGWLHQVAHNLSLQSLRSRNRQRQHLQAVTCRSGERPRSPENDLREVREEIDAALWQLPDSLREAVILCYLEGRPQDEAARLADCPRATLAWRLGEGLRRLQAILSRRATLLSPLVLAALVSEETAAAMPAAALTKVEALASVAPAANTSAAGALGNILAGKLNRWLLGLGLLILVLLGILGFWPRPAGGLITSLAYSADGRVIASGSDDRLVRLWDATTGKQLRALSGHAFPITHIAWSPDGRTLASGDWGGVVHLWNAADGKDYGSFLNEGGVSSLEFSGAGKALIIGSLDGSLKQRELADGTERVLRPPFKKPNTYLFNHLALAADGRTLAVFGGEGWEIQLWDLVTGKQCCALKTREPAYVSDLAFSPDGRLLVSGYARWDQAKRGGSDALIKVWDVRQRKELADVRGSPGTLVTAVGIAGDGRTVAWVESGTVALALKQTRNIEGTYNPAPTNGSATIKLWDLATQKELARLELPSNVIALRFAPNGQTLAIGRSNGTIHFWNLPRTSLPGSAR